MDSVSMRTRQALENEQLEHEVMMLKAQLSGLDGGFSPLPSVVEHVPYLPRPVVPREKPRGANLAPGAVAARARAPPANKQQQQPRPRGGDDDAKALALAPPPLTARGQEDTKPSVASSSSSSSSKSEEKGGLFLSASSAASSSGSAHRRAEPKEPKEPKEPAAVRPRQRSVKDQGAADEKPRRRPLERRDSGGAQPLDRRREPFTSEAKPAALRPPRHSGGGPRQRAVKHAAKAHHHHRRAEPKLPSRFADAPLNGGDENINAGTSSSSASSSAAAAPAGMVGGGGARPWSESMKLRSFEVEHLLRKPPNSDAEITATLAAVEESIQFLEDLERHATKLGVLKGTLSRWILPYDSTTAAASQQSREAQVLANTPDFVQNGPITDDECRALVRGANELRDLIRIKLADTGDLDQARAGLDLMHLFYKRLCQEAEAAAGSSFALLNRCR